MTGHAVVIAGGGPTGMMLAAELTLAGIDVAIIERRADPDLPGSRAGGLHARSIEVLDQRGIADRFLSQGQVAQVAGFSLIRLDISDFPTRHPYGLALWQNDFERILAGWVGELGVPVYRGQEVTGFTQDGSGVSIELSGGSVAAGRVPGGVRRRAQPDAQERRDRVPRLGPVRQLPGGGGRAERGTGAGHPLRPRERHGWLEDGSGRRMPDLDLVTDDGPRRVFTLLHQARPVLLNLGEPGGFDLAPWADRVQLTDAKHAGPWELPVAGEVPAPAAVLIRPDGYVAWAGALTDPELPGALTAWFGPPTAAEGSPAPARG